MLSQRSPSGGLVLRQRQYLMSRAQRGLFWGAVIIMVALVLFLLGLAFARIPEEQRTLSFLIEKIIRDPIKLLVDALPAVVLILLQVFVYRASRYETLRLTDEGIEYVSPLPGWLARLRPGWVVRWKDLRSATLGKYRHVRAAQGVYLDLDDGRKQRRLFPIQWVNPPQHQPGVRWNEIFRYQNPSAETIRQEVMESVLLRGLAQHAPQVNVAAGDLPEGAAGYALEKNPRTYGLMLAMALLFVYSLFDTVLNDEGYADAAPLWLFVAGGLLTAGVSTPWLRAGQVPWAESAGVGFLLGVAVGMALHPLLLRLNAVTDTEGLKTYQYQLAEEGTLLPPSEELPVLYFPRYPEYWAQFEIGSVHTFELRRGALGFYQIDLEPVKERWREYYWSRHNQKK